MFKNFEERKCFFFKENENSCYIYNNKNLIIISIIDKNLKTVKMAIIKLGTA